MSGSAPDLVEILLTGAGLPAAEPTLLSAGGWTLELDGPDLRHIAWDGVEVANLIYTAIRDLHWNTLPGTLHDLDVATSDRAFRVTLRSVHRYPAQGVDLAWTGAVDGSSEGQLRYRMSLTARAPFDYNRIGFNVLHGIRTYAGRPYRRSLAGRSTSGTLPVDLAPQARVGDRLTGILDPFDKLELSPVDDLWIDLAFEGDEFEMEDQRNFGEGTFKTYATPLQRPGPFRLPAGGTLDQAVSVVVRDARRRRPRAGRTVTTRDTAAATGTEVEPVRISIGAPTGRHMPPIGLGHVPGRQPLTPRERERVAALQPDHLRVEVVAADGIETLRERLGGAGVEAKDLSCALIVDLVTDPSAGTDLEAVVRVVCQADPSPARIYVASTGPVPPGSGGDDDPLVMVREVASEAARGTLVGVGSASFLADLLRRPFDGEVVGSLSFPLSPTVHRSDDASILENLDRLRDAIAGARRHLGARPLVVGPVTLATRHGPYPGGPQADNGPPPTVDPRQASLLAAAWTAGCLAELAVAGVEGVTLFATVGPEGVVAEESDRARNPVGTEPGDVYPVWHVVGDAAGWRGAQVLDVALTPAPMFAADVAALGVRDDHGTHILVASFHRDERTVLLSGVEASRARIRTLDTESARMAIREPNAFRERRSTPARVDDAVALRLGPYAVVRIDAP